MRIGSIWDYVEDDMRDYLIDDIIVLSKLIDWIKGNPNKDDYVLYFFMIVIKIENYGKNRKDKVGSQSLHRGSEILNKKVGLSIKIIKENEKKST